MEILADRIEEQIKMNEDLLENEDLEGEAEGRTQELQPTLLEPANYWHQLKSKHKKKHLS